MENANTKRNNIASMLLFIGMCLIATSFNGIISTISNDLFLDLIKRNIYIHSFITLNLYLKYIPALLGLFAIVTYSVLKKENKVIKILKIITSSLLIVALLLLMLINNAYELNFIGDDILWKMNLVHYVTYEMYNVLYIMYLFLSSLLILTKVIIFILSIALLTLVLISEKKPVICGLFIFFALLLITKEVSDYFDMLKIQTMNKNEFNFVLGFDSNYDLHPDFAFSALPKVAIFFKRIINTCIQITLFANFIYMFITKLVKDKSKNKYFAFSYLAIYILLIVTKTVFNILPWIVDAAI